jgi:DNA-directed RNA polymerase II subunit RPB2
MTDIDNAAVSAVREQSIRQNQQFNLNTPEITRDTARQLARQLIDRYFRTTAYPYTRHHIDSFDQFMSKDLPAIIRTKNPMLILKDLLPGKSNLYKYRVEIYIGGQEGTAIEIGTPTLSLQNTEEVRLLFPNEARLRNLTYASMVYVDIEVKLTYTTVADDGKITSRDIPIEPFRRFPLFKIPIMLHSRYCILNGKAKEFLRQAGECPYDHGGYFIVEGAEKILITNQQQAFNTLYVQNQERDPKIATFASITCLSPEQRITKRIAFAYMRRDETIQVTLPFVRLSIPLFILFRALGFQSDEEILHLIFPDFNSAESQFLMEKLVPSIIEARPFTNTFTAIQYIKTLTKGFGIEHVLDIIRNQFFIHMDNNPTAQAIFLGDCVRKILRVSEGIDGPTNKDDTRNQRCLVSGFLVQNLFADVYKLWLKAMNLAIGREFENHRAIYAGENFANIFSSGNAQQIFRQGDITDGLMRGFKGKWGTGLGEEKTGVLQAMSRLSYTDFMSHCRRVILEFDTSMKLTGPRHLAPSQYGYFCTSETPTGGSIGITKNLSILTAISTASEKAPFLAWLKSPSGGIMMPEILTDELRAFFVPVYVNGGMFGYTRQPFLLVRCLKLFKATGCLPYSVSIAFSIRDRRVYIHMDEGRPLRPLIVLDPPTTRGEFPIMPSQRMIRASTWRDLIFGSFEPRRTVSLDSNDFYDPFKDRTPAPDLKEYIEFLTPFRGTVEYIDPYEQNEIFVANYPDQIIPETTHVEVHPSSIMSLMTSLIPFANHNQSPRNQLSCSQSKQGLSIYATNWRNRYDNTAHILCYGQAPLTRTIYMNYLGEGRMPYGHNAILAIACWTGYNQEDNLVINGDAIQRGMFHNITYRSYETFEEDDEKLGTKTRFGNPVDVGAWKDLRPGYDYTKLDNRGIIRIGEYVDENTVICGRYVIGESGGVRDASLSPQVWTRGRVEDIAVTVNNIGLRLVKIRVVQNRTPELGDKFSNRHGQKGTIGTILRAHDLPRTRDGLVPDLIMNPHAIPSRMTIAQNLEQLLGKAAATLGAIGDGTPFMNDGSPEQEIGAALESRGFEKYGNEILYNGATGEQIAASIFVGPIYAMRLKHMVEDKWQARAEGRREQRTHQPTGGRGNQGGLKIGEQERDALIGHSTAAFLRESFTRRSDGTTMTICTSCGTVPIYNTKLHISICPLCDGPVRFAGTTASNLEIIPPLGRSKSQVVTVELPYASKLLADELNTFMNIGTRILTTKSLTKFRDFAMPDENEEELAERQIELVPLILPEIYVPEMIKPTENIEMSADDIAALQQKTSTIIANAEPLPEEDLIIDEGLTAVMPLAMEGQAPSVVVMAENVNVGETPAPVPEPILSQPQITTQLPSVTMVPMMTVVQPQQAQVQEQLSQVPTQVPAQPQAVVLPPALPTQQSGGAQPPVIIIPSSAPIPSVPLQSGGRRQLRLGGLKNNHTSQPVQIFKDDTGGSSIPTTQIVNVRKLE